MCQMERFPNLLDEIHYTNKFGKEPEETFGGGEVISRKTNKLKSDWSNLLSITLKKKTASFCTVKHDCSVAATP